MRYRLEEYRATLYPYTWWRFHPQLTTLFTSAAIFSSFSSSNLFSFVPVCRMASGRYVRMTSDGENSFPDLRTTYEPNTARNGNLGSK